MMKKHSMIILKNESKTKNKIFSMTINGPSKSIY